MTIETQERIPKPIGESKPRLENDQKVTGAAIFADDIQFGNSLLYARIMHSPHPHALIKSIDTSKAEELPGVKAIVTGDDFPGYIGLYLQDRHIFCRDRVRYVGDPVLGVAATSEEIAVKALELIDVEYEVLEPVLNPEEGAQPDAPLIHPDLGNYKVANFIFPQPGTNISNHFKLRKGDVEGAFEKCTTIVERKFRVPHIQHVPIETHVAIAQWDDTGDITLWASSQSPFAQRNLIAQALGVSQSSVRVIAPKIGGGFGCKAGVSMEALVVAISSKTKGRPVKLVLTREEEFHTAFVRQELIGYYKIGCDDVGKILAMENTYYWGGGASTEYGVNVTRAAGYSCTGPYEVPNVKADSLCVYTNHPVGGAYRGFGMPEMHTGLEQTIDELAYKAGIDPVKIRSINCVKEGCETVTGFKMHPTGLDKCIEETAKAIKWGQKSPANAPNKRRGKGTAIMWKAPAMPPNAGSSAWVELAEDGTVNIGLGGQDLGQGAFTVMAQMAAAALGVPYESIRISSPVDTRYSPYEGQTVASRLTWSMGNAVVAAAKDARKQVLDLVSEAWDEDPENLDIRDGIVVSYKSEQEQPIKDIVVYGLPKPDDQGWMGGPIIGRGKFMPSYVTGLDAQTGQGTRSVVHYTVGSQSVEVEVDLDTGRVEVLRGASAFDVGRAINPALVEAQIEGGFVQGMSSALFEEMKMVDGFMQNPSFVDYRIATTTDTPADLKSIIVEVPQDDGPWGARGIGEHPMVPTIAAIANAIYDAVGVRMESPPFSSEKVYLAMLEAGVVE